MKIYENHPEYTAYVENEIRTLEYIYTRGIFKDYKDLNATVERALLENKGKIKKGNFDKFDFHSHFLMEVEKGLNHVIIGSNVTTNFSECSYVMVVLDSTEESKIIRKFHFDYAIPATITHQKVPAYHLQYGGKMSPKMQAANLDDTKIDHWLSLPRLNFYPVNLALLFDVLFCEFRTLDTNKIVESSDWRSLIFSNERFLSYNYYHNIYTHVQSTAYKKENLIRDFCYGG